MRYGARGMGRSIYVRDPEGNVVELKQMPARGPPDARVAMSLVRSAGVTA